MNQSLVHVYCIIKINNLERIASLLKPTSDRTLIIEVGPGPGSLTRAVLNTGAKRVIGIELDTRFTPILSQLAESSESRYSTIFGDALNFENLDFDSHIKNFSLQ